MQHVDSHGTSHLLARPANLKSGSGRTMTSLLTLHFDPSNVSHNFTLVMLVDPIETNCLALPVLRLLHCIVDHIQRVLIALEEPILVNLLELTQSVPRMIAGVTVQAPHGWVPLSFILAHVRILLGCRVPKLLRPPIIEVGGAIHFLPKVCSATITPAGHIDLDMDRIIPWHFRLENPRS